MVSCHMNGTVAVQLLCQTENSMPGLLFCMSECTATDIVQSVNMINRDDLMVMLRLSGPGIAACTVGLLLFMHVAMCHTLVLPHDHT